MERMKVNRRDRRAARLRCIECDARVPLPPRPEGASGVGRQLTCPECGTSLEVGGMRVQRRLTTIRAGTTVAPVEGAGGSRTRRRSRLRAVRWCVGGALLALAAFVVLRDTSGALRALEWVNQMVREQIAKQW